MPQLSLPTTLVTVAQKFLSYGYFTLSRRTLPSRSHAFSGFPSLLYQMLTRRAHPLPEAEGCDGDQGCDSPRASLPPGRAPLCPLLLLADRVEMWSERFLCRDQASGCRIRGCPAQAVQAARSGLGGQGDPPSASSRCTWGPCTGTAGLPRLLVCASGQR